MDSATTQMLEAVRRRRANLEKIEALILEEFGQPVNGTAGNAPRSKRAYKRKTPEPDKTQKDILHTWLKANGPATRKELIAGSGLPTGTITGYLSAEKTLFEKREGKWYAL